MKKTLAMVLALVMMCTVTFVSAASFPDLKEARWDWARDTVEALTELGIVKGYSDGTYKPENSVTNEEAFTLFARVIGVNDKENAQAVADAQKLYAKVAEKYVTYASKELCFLLYRGVLEEADLKDYLAADVQDVPMKRHEAAKLITRIMGGVEEAKHTGTVVVEYTDAATFPKDAAGYIDFATKYGIMTGMGDGTFSANSGVTRAQVAIMLKRTMDRLNISYISGALADVTETSFTVNGEKFEFYNSIVVHRDGAAATIADLENGDEVTVVKTFQGVIAIDAVQTEESESNTRVIEGIYNGSYTDSRGTFVKIYDKEGGVNTTEQYLLSEGTVVYTVNGEPRVSLAAITVTDEVSAKMVSGKIVSIDAKSKEKKIENATFAGLEYVNEANMLTIGHKDAAYDDTSWPISDKVTVKRNGKDATLTDLLVGDTIALDFTYGEITKITASSKNSTVKGPLVAIHIEREQPYIEIKLSDDTLRTVYLTMDSKILIDNVESDIYDLLLGYTVTVNTESATASKITVTSVAKASTLTGTVTLVNTALGFVSVDVRDAATDEIYSCQIFVNDKTSIIAGSNGAKTKLSNIAEGDSIVATGAEKLGAFEASTIVIINK